VLGYSERTHSPRLYVNYVLSIFDINSNPQEHVPCSKVLMYRSSKSWAELYGPLFQPPRMLEGKQDHVTSRWSVALHPPCDFDLYSERLKTALQPESTNYWLEVVHCDRPITKWRFGTPPAPATQRSTSGCHTIGLFIAFAMVPSNSAQQ
jgi:hypothetical protein